MSMYSINDKVKPLVGEVYKGVIGVVVYENKDVCHVRFEANKINPPVVLSYSDDQLEYVS